MNKKFKILMLIALTLFLWGCRNELSETEAGISQNSSRKVIKLQEALAFKNYLAEIENNPSGIYSKNEDLFSSLSDETLVSVITAQNITSYSTIIRHPDKSSDVLVYSVDNENKSFGFTANYIPSDKTKNYQIDNFTGTVEYTAMDGRPMGMKELSNGVPLASKTTGAGTAVSKVDCSYSINLIEVNCNGDNHTPDQYAICTADQKPYYIIEITEICPISGPPVQQLPNMGFYDGGGGNPVYTLSDGEGINYMLNQIGLPGLSTPQYDFIQSHPSIGGPLKDWFYYNTNVDSANLLSAAIDYMIQHPNTTWQQLYDMFLATPCEKTKNIYNNTAVKSRYEVLQGHTSDAHETGYGFKTVSDGNGGTTTQTNPLDPDAANPDKMKVGIFPDKLWLYPHPSG